MANCRPVINIVTALDDFHTRSFGARHPSCFVLVRAKGTRVGFSAADRHTARFAFIHENQLHV